MDRGQGTGPRTGDRTEGMEIWRHVYMDRGQGTGQRTEVRHGGLRAKDKGLRTEDKGCFLVIWLQTSLFTVHCSLFD